MIELKELRPWEDIAFVIRRHWIVFTILWLYTFWWIILTVTLFALWWFNLLFCLIVIVFWMYFSIFIYIEWLNHELDIFIITNNRIIFIEQKSFLNRAKTECNLWQVQEVNSSTKWLLSNMLDYWILSIKTAWSTSNLEMWFVPNALNEARRVLNIVDEYRDRDGRHKKWGGDKV